LFLYDIKELSCSFYLLVQILHYKKKKEHWAKIESEFNAVIPDKFRPASVLKCKFENICRRTQNKKVQNGKQLTSTGGGKAVLQNLVPPMNMYWLFWIKEHQD